MKKLIVGALIALSLVVGASASEAYNPHNFPLSAFEYKLKIAKGAKCIKVEDKIALLKKINNIYGDNIVIDHFDSRSVALTLKKGNKSISYSFFNNKQNCNDHRQLFDQIMKQKGFKPYFGKPYFE